MKPNQHKWSKLWRFYQIIRPYKKYGVTAFVVMILVSLLQLPTPLLTKYIIDEILTHKSSITMEAVGAVLLLILILSTSANYISGFVSGLFREKVIALIQTRLFNHIQHLDMGYHLNCQPGYLISRISNDSGNLQGFLADTMVSIATNVMTFMVGLVAIMVLNAKMAVLCLLLLPVYVYVTLYWAKRIRGASLEMQEHIGHIFGDIGESLQGIYTVKAFCAEDHHGRLLENRLTRQIKYNMNHLKRNLQSGVSTGFIGGVASAFALYYGGRLVLSGEMTLGTLIAFMSFLGYVYSPVRALSSLNAQLQMSLVCLDRIFEILDLPSEDQLELAGRATLLPLPRSIKGRVEFRNITFAYDNKAPVLDNVSFDLTPGRKTALVGRSGSGKTTLTNLLLKFYSPLSGEIVVDGVSLAQIDAKQMRGSIGVVPQNIVIFSGTIRDNIRYGVPDAPEEDVVLAAQKANIHEAIMKMPDGYDTLVGNLGLKLSGGERQRIAIARAIMKKPKILIFDEATSDLDAESEYLIANAVNKISQECSLLIIAHRLATVLNSDDIIVLNEGKVIGRGHHEELVDECDLYRDFCSKQFHVITPPDRLEAAAR